MKRVGKKDSFFAASEFSKGVIAAVKKIPRGKVATYGQIAALAGKAHAPRGVAWVLHACAETHGLPWQRVINAKGKISFRRDTLSFKEQRRLLKAEGVMISHDGVMDLTKYQWKKKAAARKKSKLTPRIFG